MKLFFVIMALFLNLFTTSANCSSEPLTLIAVESQALNSSYNSKTSSAELAAAQNKAEAQRSLLYPKLTFKGNYKYVSEIPTLKFPGGMTSPFGDHQNYSFGPVLTWNIFDFGSIRKLALGADEFKTSKQAEKKLIDRQVLLAARLAYFKIQLRSEQQRLVTDSLKLAESQYKDIQNRKEAGASNRIDLLAAHKEVLNLKLQSRQLQSDLFSDLHDIYALIGVRQFNSNMNSNLISNGIDSIQESLSYFNKFEAVHLNEVDLDQHPLIKMHSANAESLRLTSESFKANELPKLSLFLKTSIDYPNGPALENIHQNTVGLTLSMPLYEGSRSSSEAAEKKNLALASESRKEQARIDLYRDWQKAKDQLKGLHDKREIHSETVTEANERARLAYSSYRAGRMSFLEVQNANLNALEAKVQATTNDIQILIQLAYLASISEEQ